MPGIVKKNPKEYSWVRYLAQRVRQNKNFLGVIVGPTGSGKSWSGLSMGEMIDPDFNIDRVIFSGRDLMKLINSGKITKKGSFILWEEAGIDLSSRNWQSLTNKMLNYLLQTFRHRCFILLFTVPYEDFVDIATRKLFHGEFKTISINFEKKTTRLKPKLYQYNPDLKKFYKKYLRVIEGHDALPMVYWDVPKPSKELIEAYEAKKTRFTSELNRNIERQLNIAENKGKKPLTELQEKILACWNKGVLKQIDIGEEVGKKREQISVNEKSMRNKGYDKPVTVSNVTNDPIYLTSNEEDADGG